MNKLLAAIGGTVVAVLLLLGGRADAAPILCSINTSDPTWDLISPYGQTADIFTVNEINGRGLIGARGVGGNNQVWVLHFNTGSTYPTTNASWVNLGGLTYNPVHASFDYYPGTQTLLPSVVVKGTDGNTYIRHFSGTSWGPWLAHSVGDGFYWATRSVNAFWYEDGYHFYLDVTQALTYGYTKCSRFDN